MNSVSRNPFGNFRGECESYLRTALKNTLPDTMSLDHTGKERINSFLLEAPPSPNYGDLASSICFEIARELKVAPQILASNIVDKIDLSRATLVRNVTTAAGYINFHANKAQLASLTLESARSFAESYGYVTVNSPLKIIIEHTSVNPVGPVHVGTARNSVIGDALARLLKTRGHEVSTHFYVDDVGRQIAVLAYGYDLLHRPQPKGKADHWIGLVYAMTSCFIEIERLKKKLKELENNQVDEMKYDQVNQTRLDLDSWVLAAEDLRSRDEALFDALLNSMKLETAPEEKIATIIQSYEKKDVVVKRLIKDVVTLCLDGFKETYNKANIFWDSWDWESDLIWRGEVSNALNRLVESPFCTIKDGALTLDTNTAAETLQLKKRFKIPDEHEIPPLVLSRSDGTTLYSIRDIAYSLWKLQRADRVVNVIGVEQSLAQLQIRVALSILTSIEKASNLSHYAYELVKLPDYKMSKRRGKYITFDEILDEATKRAMKEVDTRSPTLLYEDRKRIAETVGIGAVKYVLIDVSPSKQVVFTWDKVLNFETNSGPFIQYAYARACNILEKAKQEPLDPDYALLQEPIEQDLIKKIAIFPETFITAADSLVPNILTEFSYNLAASFNSFYASHPVLKAEPRKLRDSRLALVEGVRITLKNTLYLLGIETLERM